MTPVKVGAARRSQASLLTIRHAAHPISLSAFFAGRMAVSTGGVLGAFELRTFLALQRGFRFLTHLRDAVFVPTDKAGLGVAEVAGCRIISFAENVPGRWAPS